MGDGRRRLLAGPTVTATVLVGVSLKLSRAYHLLNQLNEAVGADRERNRPLAGVFDPRYQAHALFYEGDPPPAAWGVMAGDVVHDARSALDHLVACLVVANGKQPLAANSFPLFGSEVRYRAEVSRRDPTRGPDPLTGLTANQRGIVAECQPFAGRRAREAQRAPLLQLHRLWNVDRQRLVDVGVSFDGSRDLEVVVEPESWFSVRQISLHAEPGTLIEPGASVASISVIRHPGTPAHVGLRLVSRLKTAVAFGPAGPGGPATTVNGLAAILADALDAVRRFDPTFHVDDWADVTSWPAVDGRRPVDRGR